MEPLLHALVTPSAIPADDVELLRYLALTPGTKEKELEDWVCKYPQVIDSSVDLLPHPRIRLPGEPERYWDPDALYRASGSDYYDVIEFKRADTRLVSGGQGLSRWVPSGAPRLSTEFSRAVSQLQLYMATGSELREYFESEHSIRLFFPRGIIIAGRELDLAAQQNLRLLRYNLPSNIELITWTGILRRADAMKARRVMISLPCIETEDVQPEIFDCNLHSKVVAAFYGWTGFDSPYADPMSNWRELLKVAEEEVTRYEEENDIHANDEEWTAYRRFSGDTIGLVYYRLGKYCVRKNHAQRVFNVLPMIDHYLYRRSFRERGDAFWDGFEDAQKFLNIGSQATSVAELKKSIEALLRERRPGGKVPSAAVEPDSYYRRICTVGFLQRHLHGREIRELLRVGGWLSS